MNDELTRARARWIILNKPWETAMRYMRRFSFENGALAGIEYRLMFLEQAYSVANMSDAEKAEQAQKDLLATGLES